MNVDDDIVKTPWDAKCFGIDTYEIKRVSDQVLRRVLTVPGHYTAKVEPLFSKKLLHEYGFYYCDTLIEPYCASAAFRSHEHDAVGIARNAALDDLIRISHGAFTHGRFHRDFNISKDLADLRYDEWLKVLFRQNKVLGLMYGGRTAGFFAFSGNRILLHALSESLRGKGLSKYVWSTACKAMFDMGHNELVSSISACNAAVLNLYASLGFKFRKPLDIYHRMVL
jgi:ribosomal protein S18 acetylase RimI-like enzyme